MFVPGKEKYACLETIKYLTQGALLPFQLTELRENFSGVLW
jgi:hypothetical protein